MFGDRDENRNKILRKGIIYNFIFKLLVIGSGYVMLPIILNNLGRDLYGIWITIFTTLTWINYFDIGIANGLKNKLTESLVRKDYVQAKMHIANAYLVTFIISFSIFLLCYVTIKNISLNELFNITSINESYIEQVVITTIFLISLNFIVRINDQYYYSVQQSQIVGLKNFIYQILNLSVIIVLIKLEKLNLMSLAISYTLTQLIIEIVFTIFFFIRESKLIPTLQDINIKRIREIANLGIQFFVIQMSMLIIYNTDNFIILKFLGSEEVTIYNLTYRVFNLFIIGHAILLTPFWTIYSDAYLREDFKWIKNSIKKLNIVSFLILVGLLFVSIFMEEIIFVWTNQKFSIKPILLITFTIFVFIRIFSNVYMVFLNGVGKLKLQMYLYLIGALINIPLSLLFIKCNLGSGGVMLATVLSIIPLAILLPVQTYSILKEN